MSDSAYSFLEFGSIDPSDSSRQTWDFITGQKAYEWLMVARYLNDLVGYQTLSKVCKDGDIGEIPKIYKAEVHHDDDASINLNKLVGLSVVQNSDGVLKFLEFGSTVFGCIEGIRFCQDLLSHQFIEFKNVDLAEIEWHGIDNSAMMNSLARSLHQTNKIFTYERLDDKTSHCDLFFAKGVSLLYQIRSTNEFRQIISQARLSLFDYSLSLSGSTNKVLGTGKEIQYLDLNDAINVIEALNDKVMMVRLSNTRIDYDKNRLFLDAAFGETPLVNEYIKEDKRVRGAIESVDKSGTIAETILHPSHNPSEGWVGLREFCETHNLL